MKSRRRRTEVHGWLRPKRLASETASSNCDSLICTCFLILEARGDTEKGRKHVARKDTPSWRVATFGSLVSFFDGSLNAIRHLTALIRNGPRPKCSEGLGSRGAIANDSPRDGPAQLGSTTLVCQTPTPVESVCVGTCVGRQAGLDIVIGIGAWV